MQVELGTNLGSSRLALVAMVALASCGDGTTPRDSGIPRCAAGLTLCEDDDGVVRCVDLRSETCHCGRCGHQCLCVDGECALLDCGSSFEEECVPDVCISGMTIAYCANTFTDPEHCGMCGHVCAEGELCSEGLCQLPR